MSRVKPSHIFKFFARRTVVVNARHEPAKLRLAAAGHTEGGSYDSLLVFPRILILRWNLLQLERMACTNRRKSTALRSVEIVISTINPAVVMYLVSPCMLSATYLWLACCWLGCCCFGHTEEESYDFLLINFKILWDRLLSETRHFS